METITDLAKRYGLAWGQVSTVIRLRGIEGQKIGTATAYTAGQVETIRPDLELLAAYQSAPTTPARHAITPT